jgi:hypothetical protein
MTALGDAAVSPNAMKGTMAGTPTAKANRTLRRNPEYAIMTLPPLQRHLLPKAARRCADPLAPLRCSV